MSFLRPKRTTEDPLNGHLPPSAASEIVKAARASLKEPTRPVTPADGSRRLLTDSYANRPQTAGAQVTSHEFLHGSSSAAGSRAAAVPIGIGSTPWRISSGRDAGAADVWVAEDGPSPRTSSCASPAAGHSSSNTCTKDTKPAATRPLPRPPISSQVAVMTSSVRGGSSSSGLAAAGARSLLRPSSALAGAAAVSASAAGAPAPALLGVSTTAVVTAAGAHVMACPTAAGAAAAAAAVSAASSSRLSQAGSLQQHMHDQVLAEPSGKLEAASTGNSSSSSSSSRGSSRGSRRGSATSSTEQGPLECDPSGTAAAAAAVAEAWQRDVVQVVQRMNSLPVSPAVADSAALLHACAALQTLLDTAEDQARLKLWTDAAVPAAAAAAGELVVMCNAAAGSGGSLLAAGSEMGMQDLIVGALVRLVDCPKQDVLIKVGSMLLRLLPPDSSMLTTAAKMLYRLSKGSANDCRFRRHGVLRPLLSVVAVLSRAHVVSLQQQVQASGTAQQQQQYGGALLYFTGCLKNISVDATNQKSLGRLGAVATMSQVLIDQTVLLQPRSQQPLQQQQHEAAAQVCVQATAVLRNLAVTPGHAALFVQQQGLAFKALLQLLVMFEQHEEVLLNVSRCLSKLSLHASCRESMLGLQLSQEAQHRPGSSRNDTRSSSSSGYVPQVCQQMPAVPSLVRLLLRPRAAHSSQWPLLLRVVFVLANLTTYHPEARCAIAEVPGALDGLLQLMQQLQLHSDERQPDQPGQQQQLALGTAAGPAGPEFTQQQQQLQQNGDAKRSRSAASSVPVEDLLVKLLRLLGNVAIDEAAGPGLASRSAAVEVVLGVLHSYQFEQQEELVLNAAAALTNLVYYNNGSNEFLQLDPSMLLKPLLPLLTSSNEEATIEAARAVSNLSRGSAAVMAELLCCCPQGRDGPSTGITATTTTAEAGIGVGQVGTAASQGSCSVYDELPAAMDCGSAAVDACSTGTAVGPYLLQALVLLLAHRSWEVVYNVTGALVNLTAAPGSGAALAQVGLAHELCDVLQRVLNELSSSSSEGQQQAGQSDPTSCSWMLEAAELALQGLSNVAASSRSAAVQLPAGPLLALAQALSSGEVACQPGLLSLLSLVAPTAGPCV